MRSLRRDVSFATLAFLVTSATAFAQLSTAQLSGRVTDESGAVLPGVTSARSPTTGALR